MVHYVVGTVQLSNREWKLIPKAPGVNDHYKFETISLARKWAYKLVANDKFPALTVWKVKGEKYELMGTIFDGSKFKHKGFPYRIVWRTVGDVKLYLAYKGGSIKKV